MKGPARFLSHAFVLVFNVILLAGIGSAQRRPLISGPIDSTSRVQLAESQPRLGHALDLGSMDEADRLERMVLVLGVPSDQQHELKTLLDSQHTRGATNYHRWLTPDEFRQQYGADPDDVAKITVWLGQQGFSVDRVAHGGMWIEFSGAAGQVNAAFRTQMRRYQVGGEQHIANAAPISIPSAMASLVKGVPLHDFFTKPALIRVPVPAVTAGNGAHALSPGDFAAIYDLNPLYQANLNGQGQTIAIVAKSDVNLSDVAAFQSVFGLPSNVPNVIDDGAPPGVVPIDLGPEAALDVEWASAVAPGATIDVVAAWDTVTTDGAALSAMYIVDNNLAQIVTASFTACEQDLGAAGNALWNSIWQQAAAQGISVFVSSGDTGAVACGTPGFPTGNEGPLAVNGLASSPFVTGVGGTKFQETANGGSDATFWSTTNSPDLVSVLGYIPEKVWNDDCCDAPAVFVDAGGGGISTIYPTPPWQTLSVPGLDILKTFALPGQPGVPPRGVPDVSLAASPFHDPFLFCFTDPFQPNNPDCQSKNGTLNFQNAGGGTSFSSPAFAGLMAIVNQKAHSSNPAASPDGRQGLANYVLYPLAAAESFSSCNSSNRTNPSIAPPAGCAYNDITVGNNTVPSSVTGYTATLGYDLASGLGSVNANNLVTAWNNATAGFHGSETTLATSPASGSISINHGQSVTFAVNVQKLPGDPATQAPVGAISLIAQGGTLPAGVGVAGAPLSGASSPATTGNFNVSGLPGGNYNLVANFPGDGFFAGSSSSAIPVIVLPEASTTTLFGPVQLTYGRQLRLDVGVAGTTGHGFPSGVVTLTDGGSGFTQLHLDNQGVGSFTNCLLPNEIAIPGSSTLPCLTVGLHTITATYSGDASFNPSPNPPAASQTISFFIDKGSPIAITFPNPRASGFFPIQSTITTFLDGTSPAAVQPTGTVQFLDGTTVIGQAPVVVAGNRAQATLQATFGQGNHSLTAQYSGDNLYTSGSTVPNFLLVGVPVGWSGGSTSQTIKAGQTATYNVTLSTATGFTGQAAISCIAGTDFNNPAPVPPGVTCSVNPTSVTMSSTMTSAPVTVTIATTLQSRLGAPPFRLPWTPVVAFVAILFCKPRKAAKQRLFVLALSAAVVCGISSCGGGSSNPPPPPPPPEALTFTIWAATPGSSPGETVFNGIPVSLTINH